MNELKQIWKRRESADKILRNEFKGSAVYGLLPVEVDVLAYIAAKPNTTIQKILRDKYFDRLSLSTIKRAIVTLKTESLIRVNICSEDLRERRLEVLI